MVKRTPLDATFVRKFPDLYTEKTVFFFVERYASYTQMHFVDKTLNFFMLSLVVYKVTTLRG